MWQVSGVGGVLVAVLVVNSGGFIYFGGIAEAG